MKEQLDRNFSLQQDRQVINDNTVSYKNLSLQIPQSPIRHHFGRCTVKVYEHPPILPLLRCELATDALQL